MAVGLSADLNLVPINGIRLGVISAGIYRTPRPDLCLIEMVPGGTASAVFTTNAFCAAPVTVAREHLARGRPRYCLINAGNANAGTGARGLRDARAICAGLAALAGCTPPEVLPFSTGVIGEHLPVDGIATALPALLTSLRTDGWAECARAIMTTDTIAKGCSATIEIAGRPVNITGIAKGAGMIHPRMATLLAFIGTDARVEAPVLDALLRSCVSDSFNRITVDGDTSTNDACVLLASGAADHPRIDDAGAAAAMDLRHALSTICTTLAQSIVRDGEGATKFITVRVEQGRDEAECLLVCHAVATSPLVKTAFFASDPNWGRILAATGRAGVRDLDVERVDIFLDDICIVSGGARCATYTEQAGQEVMARSEIVVRIVLGLGSASATVWTCDLSTDYVSINADYRS
ncbi:MAG: bifunctional ornithine acetyltransferase/N-acetylglutamate synthase [Gammaproteobacteria bacterium RIFCSPLOWO2_02_FULL_61_13]|nr:MAG: bifunctional ornithine acetyltransferase/N-acetylglutamate synthase [Gammaproteobacteria bacterium RIFCSPLOWO2_02_FULL_61_13]